MIWYLTWATETNVYHIWSPNIYQARIFKQEFFNTKWLIFIDWQKTENGLENLAQKNLIILP